ncbi:hypothetical protein PR048_022445 [Dryococelus australis]|uniref:Uncharacterized protein n=1 Tax=Dryococelus australis TaxID=614101 RepID=A0ABQ9H122_9NEOP|nr:hypothetical protein PR048_022445 [Dryococelus australis]
MSREKRRGGGREGGVDMQPAAHTSRRQLGRALADHISPVPSASPAQKGRVNQRLVATRLRGTTWPGSHIRHRVTYSLYERTKPSHHHHHHIPCRVTPDFVVRMPLDLRFPPYFHSDDALYSPQSSPLALKTSLFGAAQISTLTPSLATTPGSLKICLALAFSPITGDLKNLRRGVKGGGAEGHQFAVSCRATPHSNSELFSAAIFYRSRLLPFSNPGGEHIPRLAGVLASFHPLHTPQHPHCFTSLTPVLVFSSPKDAPSPGGGGGASQEGKARALPNTNLGILPPFSFSRSRFPPSPARFRTSCFPPPYLRRLGTQQPGIRLSTAPHPNQPFLFTRIGTTFTCWQGRPREGFPPTEDALTKLEAGNYKNALGSNELVADRRSSVVNRSAGRRTDERTTDGLDGLLGDESTINSDLAPRATSRPGPKLASPAGQGARGDASPGSSLHKRLSLQCDKFPRHRGLSLPEPAAGVSKQYARLPV